MQGEAYQPPGQAGKTPPTDEQITGTVRNAVEITVRVVTADLDDDELLAIHMAMLTDSRHPENVLGWDKAKPLWDRGPGQPVHDLTKLIVGRIVTERFPR